MPIVKRYGDVENIKRIEKCEIISAGFPCQDLSVAGKRAGLAGARSGLFWEIIRIARKVLPRWILIENVPGLLSSNDGWDFGIVQSALGELGYGVAWRVLNSQYFGVPQRRRRVFIIGYLGNICPEEVLFESEGLPRNIATGRKEGPGIARTLTGGVTGGRSHGKRSGDDRQTMITAPITTRIGGSGSGWPRYDEDKHLIVNALQFSGGPDDNDAQAGRIIPTLRENYRNNSSPVTEADMLITHTLRAEGFDASENGTGRGAPLVAAKVGVRRLTPLECERLQGFPDGWTACIRPEDFEALYLDGEYYSQQELSDSARYRLLGNAVTVNVAEWLGRRIVEFDLAR